MPSTRTSGRRNKQASGEGVQSSPVTPRTRSGRQLNGPRPPPSKAEGGEDAAPSSLQAEQQTSARKRKRNLDPADLAEGTPVERETPSKRSRKAEPQAGSARKAAQKQVNEEAEEPESVDELAQVTPAASKVVDIAEAAVRSSGRTRKKTTKQAEMEEVQESKVNRNETPSRRNKISRSKTLPEAFEIYDDATPVGAKRTTQKRTLSQRGKKNAEETPMDVDQNANEKTSVKKPSRIPTSRSGRKGVRSGVTQVDDAQDVVEDEPGTRGDQDATTDTAQQLASSAVPSAVDTPSRKRGRPKGSGKSAIPPAALELPFEDVPLDPTMLKTRKGLSPLPPTRDSSEDLIATAIAATANLPFLASTAPATAPSALAVPNEDESCATTAAELAALLAQPTMASAFAELKQSILLRCSGRTPTPITGLAKEYAAVRAVIQQTVAAGEGNSLLVIGARGSGKTAAVETALADVGRAHGSDFHAVRLNGFVHTDDKVALREIWRQLGRETQPDVAGAKQQQRINYADTLASLLAVLSHPAELEGHLVEAETPAKRRPKNEPAQTAAKAVVVVLDEFDQFATHARQTLLYNLLDVAQARKAPLAVLGLTTRLDAAEALEKRVKSRFSHRHVHIAPPRTFSAYLDVLRAALGCAGPDADGHAEEIPEALRAAWTAHVAACLSAAPLATHLRRIFAHTKSVPQALQALLPALSRMDASSIPLPSTLSAYFPALAPPDSKLPPLLPALSDSELALLAAAARLDALHATDSVASFALAFDEYGRLARRAAVAGATPGGVGAGARVWSRDVCLAAWDGLAHKGLLVPVVVGEGGRGGGAGTGGTADTGRAGRLWRVDVSLEEIGRGIDAWGGGGAAAREVGRWCKVL